MRKVGEYVRTLALRFGGMSAAAEAVGENLSNFMNVLSGKRSISKERLDRWLRALGASPTERLRALEAFIRARSNTEMEVAMGLVELERSIRLEVEADLAAERAVGQERAGVMAALRAKIDELERRLEASTTEQRRLVEYIGTITAELGRAQEALRRQRATRKTPRPGGW